MSPIDRIRILKSRDKRGQCTWCVISHGTRCRLTRQRRDRSKSKETK